MILSGSSEPEGAQQALWLIRSGILAAVAMAAALIGVSAALFLAEGPSPRATVLLLLGATTALAGPLLIRQVILDLARREERAARDAGHDILSGLANRKLFGQWIDYELARGSREPVSFAVMYLDIDHFKDINDRHGHDAGDRMIVAVAKRLAETLRPTDRLARFGGDEFAILQTGVRTMRDAEALACRILDAMRNTFHLGRVDVVSSVSVGIALCPANAADRDDLLKRADLALYRAKREGRNRFAFFDARMGEDLARRRAFGVELAQAIESDALVLEFQPVFAAGVHRIVAVKGRLRWPHAERGAIERDDLMAIAEERGLLLPLGDRLLQRACATALPWSNVRVCVDVSAVQFNHRDFAARVLDVLRDTGLEPARLDLCIGEECILQAKADAVAGMELLRRKGVRFTLARYGAGVASLNFIRRLPFSRVELDRACVDFAPGITADAAVLHASIHLGRALGLTMAADGVEQASQARYLTALGCDELQGGLLCRPASAAHMQLMLSAQGESGDARPAASFAPARTPSV